MTHKTIYILFDTSFLCFIALSDGRGRRREFVNDGDRMKIKATGGNRTQIMALNKRC